VSKKNVENIYHLFWECEITRKFWSDFEKWINPYTGIPTLLTAQLVCYGNENNLMHTLIMPAKRTLYDSKNSNTSPNIHKFELQVKYLHKIEFEIASKNENMNHFIDKWNPLLNYLK
jgi:hypothetical protein